MIRAKFDLGISKHKLMKSIGQFLPWFVLVYIPVTLVLYWCNCDQNHTQQSYTMVEFGLSNITLFL